MALSPEAQKIIERNAEWMAETYEEYLRQFAMRGLSLLVASELARGVVISDVFLTLLGPVIKNALKDTN